MSKEVTKSRVEEIKKLHNEIAGHIRTSLEKAFRVGELLCEQKKLLKHGQFCDWIRANLPFTVRTGQNYMRVFRNKALFKNETVSHLAQAYNLLPEKTAGDERVMPESFSVAEWIELISNINHEGIRDKHFFVSLDTSFWENKWGGSKSDGSMTLDEIRQFALFFNLHSHLCFFRHWVWHKGLKNTSQAVRRFLSLFGDIEKLENEIPPAICNPGGNCKQECWAGY